MDSIIVMSEKQLRPSLRNIMRAIALECECLIRFEYKKGASYLKKDEERTGTIVQNGISYSLDALIEDTKDLLERKDSFNSEFTGKWAIFFGLQSDPSEWRKLQKIINFVIEKVSNYQYNGEPEDVELSQFYHKWKRIYSGLKQFPVAGNALINRVNRQEVAEYKRAFDIIEQEELALSIQNAIASLLDTIPEDVEKLLDVGAGPGYVDAKIPEDIQVLAMDIDEKILEMNPRSCCLGDILNIPLPDSAVDMTIACDVLEHIEPQHLASACAEMKRVTGRYIYVQVPYKENLDMGLAYCGKCNRTWHVNFHKNNFDETRLLNLLGEGWQPVLVNYTGECMYDDNQQPEFILARHNSLPVNQVTGWKCPVCGKNAVLRNSEIPDLLSKMEREAMRTFPRYTEIGVLFVRNNFVKSFCFPRETKYREFLLKQNELRLCDDHFISNMVNMHECRPFIYTQVMWKRVKGGISVKKPDAQTFGWIGAVFPLYFMEDDWIEVEGKVEHAGNVVITSAMIDGNEVGIENIHVEAGTVEIRIPCPIYLWDNRVCIKVYFDMDEMEFNRIGVSRKVEVTYKRIIPEEVTDFYRKKRNGLLINYCIRGMHFLDMTEECVQEQEKEERICGRILANVLKKNEIVIAKLQQKLSMYRLELAKEKEAELKGQQYAEIKMLQEQIDLFAPLECEIKYILDANTELKELENDDTWNTLDMIEEHLLEQDLTYAMYVIQRRYPEIFKEWLRREMDILMIWGCSKPFLYKFAVKTGIRDLIVHIIGIGSKKTCACIENQEFGYEFNKCREEKKVE